MKFKRERTAASLAVSIAAHTVLISMLLSIVFRYPLGQLVGIPRQPLKQERVTFIKVEPAPPTPSSHTAAPEQGARPAALQAPTTPPDVVLPPEGPVAKAAGSDGRGRGVVGAGIATGVVPLPPDPRIDLSVEPLQRAPMTVKESVDELIALSVGIVNDSLGTEREQAKPVEWIKKTRFGDVGLTRNYLALGPVKIPTALLALTPLNRPTGPSPIERRREQWMRRDILENAQRSVTEEEFRTAVRRIRERKEREAREKLVADSKAKDNTTTPQVIVP